MNHPQRIDQLPGSQWTARKPKNRERHWSVIGASPRAGTVTLQAVLTGRSVTLPWRGLRDRERWLPGWIRGHLHRQGGNGPMMQKLRRARTSRGDEIGSLLDRGPLLLVFLRHFG